MELGQFVYFRARRRRLSRRQRSVSTNSSTLRSSATPQGCPGQHTLPALPGEDLSIPLPPDVDVNYGMMTWWKQPNKHDISQSVCKIVRLMILQAELAQSAELRHRTVDFGAFIHATDLTSSLRHV